MPCHGRSHIPSKWNSILNGKINMLLLGSILSRVWLKKTKCLFIQSMRFIFWNFILPRRDFLLTTRLHRNKSAVVSFYFQILPAIVPNALMINCFLACALVTFLCPSERDRTRLSKSFEPTGDGEITTHHWEVSFPVFFPIFLSISVAFQGNSILFFHQRPPPLPRTKILLFNAVFVFHHLVIPRLYFSNFPRLTKPRARVTYDARLAVLSMLT